MPPLTQIREVLLHNTAIPSYHRKSFLSLFWKRNLLIIPSTIQSKKRQTQNAMIEAGYSLIPKMLLQLEIFVIFLCKNLSLDSAREKSH